MSFVLVGQYFCERCKHQTLLPSSILANRLGHRIWSTSDGLTLTVLCMHCSRVDTVRVTVVPILAVDNPFGHPATLAAFSVKTRCDVQGCDTRREVVAVYGPDITDKDVQAEFPTWQLDGLRCPKEHAICGIETVEKWANSPLRIE